MTIWNREERAIDAEHRRLEREARGSTTLTCPMCRARVSGRGDRAHYVDATVHVGGRVDLRIVRCTVRASGQRAWCPTCKREVRASDGMHTIEEIDTRDGPQLAVTTCGVPED